MHAVFFNEFSTASSEAVFLGFVVLPWMNLAVRAWKFLWKCSCAASASILYAGTGMKSGVPRSHTANANRRSKASPESNDQTSQPSTPLSYLGGQRKALHFLEAALGFRWVSCRIILLPCLDWERPFFWHWAVVVSRATPLHLSVALVTLGRVCGR